MSLVDLSSFLPYIVFIIMDLIGMSAFEFDDYRRIMTLLRIMLVLRIFKLVRFSPGLQSFALTLQRCSTELGLLLLYVAIGVVFFASLCFFAEKEEAETSFVSIPASMWWAISTMTTVGYGDISPNTWLGKVIG